MALTLRQPISRLAAAIVAALFGGLLYVWFAPYSSETGVLLAEVPLLLLFFIAVALVTSIAAWATRRTAFSARFWVAVLAGAWAGVVLAEYFYPPQARRILPPHNIDAGAQNLCERFLRNSPWFAKRSSSIAVSCRPTAMSAPKGVFGWRSPGGWPVSLAFRYRDGAHALLIVRADELARFRLERLVLTYPRTAPPVWSDLNFDTWWPARWPWQWAEDDADGPPPLIRRKRECDATPDCPKDAPDSHWRFDVTFAGGRTLSWIARTPPAGSQEEVLLFLHGDWSLATDR